MIKTAYLTLELEEKAKTQKAQHLRGFFANTFSNIDLFHNHNEDGKSIYRYPLMQYRFLNNRPHITGIAEGSDKLIEKYDSFEDIKIGSNVYKIMEKQLSLKENKISQIDNYITYRFITPWFALNQDNHKKYLNIENSIEKENFLEDILTANLISLSKGLNYTVKDQIKIKTFLNQIQKPLRIKDQSIITFNGIFRVNMDLPEYFGIGKSVSKGFGTIIKCNN